MLIHLHNRAMVRHWSEKHRIFRHWFKNNGARPAARATPKLRAAIQAGDEPASVPAARFGTTGPTSAIGNTATGRMTEATTFGRKRADHQSGVRTADGRQWEHDKGGDTPL